MNFAGDFLVDFWGPSSLGKTGRKNPPQNPQQSSNQNLGASRQKSTLQGSGLDYFFLEASQQTGTYNNIRPRWQKTTIFSAITFLVWRGPVGNPVTLKPSHNKPAHNNPTQRAPGFKKVSISRGNIEKIML